MGKVFEFLVLLVLIVLLIGGFFFYVYVIVLGNSLPIAGGKVLGQSDYNYNFTEPIVPVERKDFVISNTLKETVSKSNNPNAQFTLSIPKIDINTTVTSTNNIDRLNEQGWFLLPNSYKYEYSYFRRLFDSSKRNRNEAIILCQRNFYGIRDVRSCFYLDRIEVDNELTYDGSTYKVISTKTIPTYPEYVFEPNTDGKYLRIISNSGPKKEPYLNSHFLVIIAEKKA